MFGAVEGGGVQGPERSICALTMGEHVFVLLEDPAAPTRADVLALDEGPATTTTTTTTTTPPHYRTTFLTLRPPGALEQLLNQLNARWMPVRQTSSSSQRVGTAQQLSIEGHVFAIGSDWLVRIANVVLPGGAVKGMLLEVGPLSLPR